MVHAASTSRSVSSGATWTGRRRGQSPEPNHLNFPTDEGDTQLARGFLRRFLEIPLLPTLATPRDAAASSVAEAKAVLTAAARKADKKARRKQGLAQKYADAASCPGSSAKLVDAASRSDLRGVREQVVAGADVNAQDAEGNTALIWAAIHGNLEIARYLHAAGASPRITGAAKKDCFQIAWHTASYQFNSLLQSGVQLRTRKLQTFLCLAVRLVAWRRRAMHRMYAPGGTGYERARAEFEVCVFTGRPPLRPVLVPCGARYRCWHQYTRPALAVGGAE